MESPIKHKCGHNGKSFHKENNVPRWKGSYQGIIITEHFTNLPKYAKTKSNNSNIYDNSNSKKKHCGRTRVFLMEKRKRSPYSCVINHWYAKMISLLSCPLLSRIVRCSLESRFPSELHWWPFDKNKIWLVSLT